MAENQQDFQWKDKYKYTDKPRHRILIDNLIGGLAWGVGTVLGATIIVGIFGLIVASSKQIPLVGQVVQVIEDEINQGRNSALFSTTTNNSTTTTNTNTTTTTTPVVSYP